MADLNILIVRELTAGVYFGQPRGIRTSDNGEKQGCNNYAYCESKIKRIGRLAFESAERGGTTVFCR